MFFNNYFNYLLIIFSIVRLSQQFVANEKLWCPPNNKLVDKNCVSLTPKCPENFAFNGKYCVQHLERQQQQQQDQPTTQLCNQGSSCVENVQPCYSCQQTRPCQQNRNCAYQEQQSYVPKLTSIEPYYDTFPATVIQSLKPLEPHVTLPPIPVVPNLPSINPNFIEVPLMPMPKPIYISRPQPPASVNPSSVSNLIEITNIVHNNNTINNPTNINSTNVNNIFVYGLTNTRVLAESGDDKKNITHIENVERSDVTVTREEPCCTVMTPRQCKYENNQWICYHRKYNRCGEFCTNPQVFMKPRRPIYVDPVAVIPPRYRPGTQYTPNCQGNACPPTNCSGCMNRRRSSNCSSECYNYDCRDKNCGYIDQNNFCATYGGAGCNEDDGCYASAGCRNY